MAPVKPMEHQEWVVIGGCVKNIGLRFGCHAQILIGEVAGPKIASYAAIPPRPTQVIFLRQE